MGKFVNATNDSIRIENNKTAPDYFMRFDKVDIKTVTDVITIDNIIVRVRPKHEKDKDGNYLKDENGKFIVKVDFNKNPVMGAVAFVSFDDNKYFVTTSRPIINQCKMLDSTVDLKTVGDYPVKDIKGSKVKISSIPQKLNDGKEYEYPVFIDVE